ncbi:MAG: hypothetical protein JO112_13140 [Planctomycetes bacterium]|nr:hypothetical protein [Planctomycetota bacterium]
MSRTLSPPDEAEVAALTFVPLATPRGVPSRKSVELAAIPLVQELLRTLGQPLADLARRARRLGPVQGGAVLLLTGCRRGAGCSTVALCLAAAAAAERPTLLLDADLLHAGLSAQLGGGAFAFGWEEILRGLPSPQTLFRPPDQPGVLSFLPLQQPVHDPLGLLTQPALPGWLAGLRQVYDLVILDGGPVQESGAGWASWADVAILVKDGREPSAADCASAWDLLEEGGTHVLGLVETFVPSSR